LGAVRIKPLLVVVSAKPGKKGKRLRFQHGLKVNTDGES
jgi:hypothetical protein